jgi:hypothetical protein
MLRISVSVVTQKSERELGRLEISRAKMARGLADYRYELRGGDLSGPVIGTLARYPRVSATVWDLVVRVLARAIYGAERLRKRLDAIYKQVPIRVDDSGLRFVRIADIS